MAALPRKVLLKKVNKFESKGLENNKFPSENLSELEKLLADVYTKHRPSEDDYFNRKDLIRIFNVIAKEIYGNSDDCPVVEGFGSYIMDLFTARSDLDLSINFGNASAEIGRDQKIQTLRKFAKKMYNLQRKGHVTGIQPIMTARVPIVKVIDRGTGIECDLSVENRDGMLKSQILQVISTIDERFQKLSFLMKVWAKAHNINSSKDRTLNSLSIISLVVFHLQTRDPPILPPFSALFKDGTDPANVKKNVSGFVNYGKANKESLAVLFVTLLIKLSSVEKLWPKGLCASLYEGSWISKAWDSDVAHISVEDFTERSQNVSRAVGVQAVKTIYFSISTSLHHLITFLNGKLLGPKLRELLFGLDDVSRPEAGGIESAVATPKIPAGVATANVSTSCQSIQAKKARRDNASGYNHPVTTWGGNNSSGNWTSQGLGWQQQTQNWGGNNHPATTWGGNNSSGNWTSQGLGWQQQTQRCGGNNHPARQQQTQNSGWNQCREVPWAQGSGWTQEVHGCWGSNRDAWGGNQHQIDGFRGNIGNSWGSSSLTGGGTWTSVAPSFPSLDPWKNQVNFTTSNGNPPFNMPSAPSVNQAGFDASQPKPNVNNGCWPSWR